ncbi:MAG: N,N'-diacetylbacillosaminyl-diphospho-undecaprenol alpha-1,3-N-acetylgalactosaminyltransferase [Alphaproteobacteria bacterium MarineAlpha8_Bin1]|nr:MAG: N,N'-diacetylbacillosaminyl-diphospho-undecaprenol alpha-1,3-N-acetylgalactosaminyltransferase [Alphaproteobacteria bacterium MarineAlpha8_Bin1]
MKKFKLLYFVSEDEYFVTHKLAQALEAKKKNFNVVVLTKLNKFKKKIESLGIKTLNFNLDRKSINPISNFFLIIQFYNIIRKEKPDIIQSNALKPILYSALISRFFKNISFIYCVVGLGFLFLKKNLSNSLIRKIYFFLLKKFIKKEKSIFIFQNKDDLEFFKIQKIINGISHKIISGSGVNNKKFRKKKMTKTYDLILHSRILEHKGIYELVNAVIHLKKEGLNIKFLLLGNPDLNNRASIPRKKILKWQSDKILTWKKKVINVIPYLHKSKISVLPSYREGFPRSLLEAASCGLPLISTNVPGCRDICINNFNGYLVSPKDYLSLAKAIKKLINNPIIQKKFSDNSINIVKEKFMDKIISSEFVSIYKSILK